MDQPMTPAYELLKEECLIQNSIIQQQARLILILQNKLKEFGCADDLVDMECEESEIRGVK